MIEHYVIGETLPEAYHHALWSLCMGGEIVDCPDYNTRCKELPMTIEVGRPLKEPMISRLIPCGPEMLQEYCMEMIDGIKDFAIGHGWAYTYHDRMRWWSGCFDCHDQILFVLEELKRNPNSRRAVIDVRNNDEDMCSDDPACLQHIQYFIRSTPEYPNGQLDCKVLFRSNDAMKATYMNMYALIRLQEVIATELGVHVGTYVHRSNSFHAYERDWELLESYAEAVFHRGKTRPLYYDYKGDWEEQMNAAVPEILKKVEAMKHD